MPNHFFEQSILNSPYEEPTQHWELDANGQPTQHIIEHRRKADFIMPIPKSRKRKGKRGRGKEYSSQSTLHLDTNEGRSYNFRINYKTSHQIWMQADQLLSSEIADVDGNKESGTNTQSVFNGPVPQMVHTESVGDEIVRVSQWIRELRAEEVPPEEIAVCVRSKDHLERARQAITKASESICELDERLQTKIGAVTLSTMHLAKGLEFWAVAVMACDQDVIPDAERLENFMDMAEIDEVYETNLSF